MPFNDAKHADLVTLLASSDYLPKYLAFCDRYPRRGEGGRAPLDLRRGLDIFKEHGISCKLNRRFKVFTFDEEEIAGWHWHGSLVVQRHDGLEPMMEGCSAAKDVSVGSTLLALAVAVGREARPSLEVGPPYPRPNFDGDMQTMSRARDSHQRACYQQAHFLLKRNWVINR